MRYQRRYVQALTVSIPTLPGPNAEQIMGRSKGKTPYGAWECSATGFSTAVTQKANETKKATLECQSNLLTLLCKKISKFPRTKGASLLPRWPEKGFFLPLPSSMAHRHLRCVGLVAGWKTPGSFSVNKTHVDGLPWHQQPMGFCVNSFSPRRRFDLKMLKQLKREREKGFKTEIAENLQYLHSHHSSSCRKPREQEMWGTASCPVWESGSSSELLWGPWNKDMQAELKLSRTCGVPGHKSLHVPHFLLEIGFTRPPWPSLSSKEGITQLLISEGRGCRNKGTAVRVLIPPQGTHIPVY